MTHPATCPLLIGAVIASWLLAAPSPRPALAAPETLLAQAGPGAAGTRRPARERGGALDYIDGIDALEAADYRRAVASLTRAIAADGDNADYHRARGVANTLAENFSAAIADLQRALTLRPADRETRLWLGAAHVMNGEPQKGSFTHGRDVPPDYASLVYNDMAHAYWSSRYRGVARDPEQRRNVPVREPVRTRFPDAARAYAQRHKASGPEPGDALLARVKANVGRGDCAAAMKDLAVLRRGAPDDPGLRGTVASCLLAAGDALHARAEFTRALILLPLWVDGYLGRAQAAAILGDERRAQADLEAAHGQRAGAADAVREKVAKLSSPRPPADAPQRFVAGVEAEAAWPALVDAALAVQRWGNARRIRYDEAYQDRIRVLSEAVRDDPRGAGPPEMLARFLYRHHVTPVVWNGPRGGGEQLRPQSPAERQGELARGLELTDGALKLDARHANTLATRGMILHTLGRGGEAQTVVDRGLAAEPRNVNLLRLKARILGDAAAALDGQVAALRTPRTETTRERRSDGIYEVTRHYPPSAEALARAAALEAQARGLRQQAAKLLDDVKQVETTIAGLMKDGDAKLAARDAAGARRAFEQVYAWSPDHEGLAPRLADVFQFLGDARRQRIFALLGEPMRHTTAAGELKTAWEHASRTAWNAAAEALERAAALDIADARAPAYRSVVAAGRGDARAAERARRAALALEEARARLMGTTFVGDGGPVEPLEAGLSLILRLQSGNASIGNAAERAVEAYGANVAIEKRVAKERLVELVPSAMLPAAAAAGIVPDAPTLASLLAWSRLGTGRALLALGRPADAQREYRAVRAYLASWPPTAKDRETMYVVDSWARLGVAEAAYAARDYDGAFKLLMSGEGWPGRLPEELELQRKALSEKVVAARRRG